MVSMVFMTHVHFHVCTQGAFEQKLDVSCPCMAGFNDTIIGGENVVVTLHDTTQRQPAWPV